jgi:soluble lytic murein transglycosylase-like protein
MIKVILLTAVLNQHTPGAGVFAPYFVEMGIKYQLDPLLIAAVAYHESQFDPRVVSRTNDYGLMQIHVGRRFNKKYIGREYLLLDPRRNIMLGAKLMKMWRTIHHRRCKGHHHHWLNHYNQGTNISSKKWHRRYAARVMRIYDKLIQIKHSLAGTV